MGLSLTSTIYMWYPWFCSVQCNFVNVPTAVRQLVRAHWPHVLLAMILLVKHRIKKWPGKGIAVEIVSAFLLSVVIFE